MLSAVLPVLHSLGVRVVDERPYEVHRIDATIYLYDFGLQLPPDARELAEVRPHMENAFSAVWRGEAEVDGFNELVLRAGLTWRQVVVLRAYAKYLRQAGTVFSQEYMERTFLEYPGIAALLVALFETRFDPRLQLSDVKRAAQAEQLTEALAGQLDAVASLDQDRILRSYLTLIEATLRTSFYQRGDEGRPKSYVAFKLDPQLVPDLPAPRPRFEIFVYSPRFEGVHLRFGAVARGGLRWSDRREDFRTEVLGLVKAQMVKNAVIVPVGAKGGFVLKQGAPPATARRTGRGGCLLQAVHLRAAGRHRQHRRRQGRAAPRRGPSRRRRPVPGGGGRQGHRHLLRHRQRDLNVVRVLAGRRVRLRRVGRLRPQEDGHHRPRRLGVGQAALPGAGARHPERGLHVVGVGDMSGDVFGNGMLLSEHTRLVAAFDHRHIFVDPTPDAASSYAERKRLFDLPRSSWADYDTALISAGGGVWPRTAKSIPISPQMRIALGLDDGVRKLSPDELMRAILKAAVDLLWNGGIGTYVKARTETNAEVGDKSNDAVRINGRDLRCRVVGEGGNLGLTQRGRIEFALRGG